MQIPDETAEKLARAIYCGLQFVTPWDEADGAIRRFYQRVARLAWEATQTEAITDKPQGITDEAVEAAARAMYERQLDELSKGRVAELLCWNDLLDVTRDWWRDKAHAGLRAAGVIAVVHLCDTCLQSKCWTRRDIEHACEDSQFPARAVVVECAAYKPDKRVEEVLQGVEGA